MKAKIHKHHKEGRATYGARRIQRKLAETDDVVSRRRINRLMTEEGLECKTRKKFKATTNSKHGMPVAPNLLDRIFSAEEIDQKYVGDITYIPTREGWLYLAESDAAPSGPACARDLDQEFALQICQIHYASTIPSISSVPFCFIDGNI